MRYTEDKTEVMLSVVEYAQLTAAAASMQSELTKSKRALDEQKAINKKLALTDLVLVENQRLRLELDRRHRERMETVSILRGVFTVLYGPGGGSTHPEDCPCGPCDAMRFALTRQLERTTKELLKP